MRDNVLRLEYSRATLRNCGDRRRRDVLLAFLPLNRVALFAAQITRESLDTRGLRIESRATTTDYCATDRSLSRHYEISLSPFLSLFLCCPLFFLSFVSFVRPNRVFFANYSRTSTCACRKNVEFLWKLNA